jgi:hypothetical protein
MSGKERVEVSKNSEKVETRHLPAVIVAEGSMVVLDAHDLIGNIDANSIRNYSWT